MKKLMTIALVALMGASACQKEGPDYNDNTTPTNGDYVSFTADFASLASKAAADYDDESKTLTLSWEVDDNVGVYSSQTPILYKATKAGESTTLTTNIKLAKAANYSAVYPYMADALMDGGRISLTVPAEQRAVADSPEYHVAVAKTAGTSFSFRNVTAAVRLELTADNITKIELKGKSGELLAGDIKVNPGDASFSDLLNGSAKVTLLPVVGTVFEPGVYYASLLPQSLSQGFTVTYYNGENATDKTSDEAIALDGNTLIVCEAFGLSVEGTKSNPFQIGSVTDLQGLSAKLKLDVPNYVVLTKEIDMAGVTSWTPIVNTRDAASTPELHFDGKGFAIRNFAPTTVTADVSGKSQASLFGVIYGSIKNLKMTGVGFSVTTDTSAPLAGFVGLDGKNKTIISNVEISGTMSGNKVVGGCVGTAVNADFENCHTAVNVTAADAEGGGFIGRLTNGLSFSDCSATGDVAGARAAGGFAGGSNTSSDAVYTGRIDFKRCYATGNVTGTYQMGAFAGHIHTAQVSFEDCYAVGDVETNGTREHRAKQIGGMVGVNSGATLVINRCFYEGAISKGYIEVGGILGKDASGSATITSSFALADITTNAASKQNGGIVGMACSTKTTVTDCYAGGSISSAGTVGGILGETSTIASVKNCVWGGTGTDAIAGKGVVPENSAAVTESDKADYATSSKIASKLGWSTGIWDLSGTSPVLK